MNRNVYTCAAVAALMLTAAAGSATAGFNIYPVAYTKTNTTMMSSGDRCLDNLGFFGTDSQMDGADLMRFNGGMLTDATGAYSWDDGVTRGADMPKKLWAVTPDRGHTAQLFAGEPAAAGSVGEIFGSSLGYKNLSWMIDGKKKKSYSLDLTLNRDNYFTADNDPKTVELAILERGGDSDMNVYGITGYSESGAPILTQPIFISRNKTLSAGWTIDTLGSRKAERVEGAGLSLPSEWGTIIGIRIENQKKFNGADIVGVAIVPTPGSAALMGVAGLTALRRRRK